MSPPRSFWNCPRSVLLLSPASRTIADPSEATFVHHQSTKFETVAQALMRFGLPLKNDISAAVGINPAGSHLCRSCWCFKSDFGLEETGEESASSSRIL